MVRALLLFAASTLFSGIAYVAGLSRVANPDWIYAGILAIVLAAVLVSRIGAKFVMRRSESGARPPGIQR